LDGVKRWIAVGSVVVVAIVAIVWWRHGGSSTQEPAGGPHRTGEIPATPTERAATGGPIDTFVVLADDDPKGTLRLEGQVLDAQDHPVAGATVVLGSAPPRTVTTEGDGSFAFDGLVGRPYTVVARAAQGVAGPVTARLTDKTEPLILRLRAGATLTVDVVGIDAKPIDGATIELRGVDRQTVTATKGSAKLAPVVPGMYEVVGYAPGTAKTFQTVRVTGDTKVRIMLAPGAPASGRVVDDRGTPVSGAHVIFAAAGEFRGQGDPHLDGVTTGGDGTFRFPALPAGSFRFVANHPEHAPGTSPLVALDGKSEKTGITIQMAAGAVVHGRVVDIAKKPVSGARVRIGEPFGQFGDGARGRRRGGARQPPHQAYTDAQGEFEIRGLPRAELEATASHESGASSAVTVDTTKGDVVNVVLTLDMTLTIAGVVVDPAGQPIEGVQVSAIPRDGPRGLGGRETTDGSGKFKLTGLAAGTYFVRASRSALPGGFGGRNRARDGIEAEAGKQDVRIVLPAEGSVKGKVAFSDGSSPVVFTASVGSVESSFAGGEFLLGAIAPGDYQLRVRGPMFDTRTVDISVDSNKTTDVGTIVVAAGRQLAGIVVANGQPVAGATVYAGAQLRGIGSTTPGGFGGADPKTDTTGPDGSFALAGFGEGDVAIVADLPSIGRSKALRVTDDAPNQSQLVLELQAYGSLSGVLHQGASAQGVAVTAQSTTTPGALFVVQAGADGAYRFDRLAPDTYKVSATLGNPRRGMHFYSKQIDVPLGTEVTLDLSVDAGAVTVTAQPVGSKGQVGLAIGWLATGAITATTANELQLKLAAAGTGASQMVPARPPDPSTFTEVVPGPYTACFVPLPLEVRGQQAIGYMGRHATKLPAYCQAVTVAPSPATQAITVPVVVPAMIPDNPPPGGGP
jgi:hypothetical protein